MCCFHMWVSPQVVIVLPLCHHTFDVFSVAFKFSGALFLGFVLSFCLIPLHSRCRLSLPALRVQLANAACASSSVIGFNQSLPVLLALLP